MAKTLVAVGGIHIWFTTGWDRLKQLALHKLNRCDTWCAHCFWEACEEVRNMKRLQ